jgi:hypothetical protein
MPKRKGTSTNDASVSANKKACQRYKQEYSTFWKCLQASTKGETYVRCVICKLSSVTMTGSSGRLLRPHFISNDTPFFIFIQMQFVLV